MGETWPKYPRERLTSFYKNVRSRDKRFWSMDWPGQELPPRGQADNGLIATFIAEAYVNGCYSRYPQKLDKWPGVKAKVDPYFAFVRGNEELFVRPDAEIGLFYSLSNCAGTLRREGVNAHAYHAAARLLEDAHRSYEVIFAGNDTWVPYDLTFEDIKSYKLIVLPHIRYMSQTQREMILDYLTNGGIIVTMGDIGTHNLDGAEYPLTEWNNLFEKGGSHRHGKGRIYHFADIDGHNFGEHYGYGRKRKGKLEDLKRFSDVLKLLLPPQLKTNLPSTVAVHRNVNPSNGSIVLHLLNYDYDAGRDQIRPVNKASLEMILPESMPAGNVRAVYYELANLPNGKLLKCKAAGDGAVTVVIPRVLNWGTLVIKGTKG